MKELTVASASAKTGASSVELDRADVRWLGATKAVSIPTALHRDPVDMRNILSLTRLGIFISLLLVESLGATIYQYLRRPVRIVVDSSSRRALMIRDLEHGG